MRDPRDYKVDLASAGAPSPADGHAAGRGGGTGRPFLSVRFACCNVYTRVYRAADGSAYRGRCPKCGKPVNFVVGEGGTDSRFFVVK